MTRLCAALLRLAARRWPAAVRDDLSREWQAELHVLATRGSALPMLAYAASLAVSRPAADPLLDRSTTRRFTLRTAAFLLLAPVAGVAGMIASLLLMNAAVYRLVHLLVPGDYDTMFLQEPLATTFVTLFAVVLALAAWRLGRRSALRTLPALAVGAGLPCGLVTLLLIAAGGNADKVLRAIPELTVWTVGIVLVLLLTARAAVRGGTRRAWPLGLLGAFAVADLAIMVAVFGNTSPATVLWSGGASDGIEPVWAPLWLPGALTGTSLGLPGPTRWEITQVVDIVGVTPYLYLIFTPYLVTYAITAARAARARATSPESTSDLLPDADTVTAPGSAAGTASSA